jgi:uncharacterized protein YggU (UPF0235/DUF167 family)
LKNISSSNATPATAASPNIAASPFSVGAGGVRLRVRVTPRASANRIGGLVGEADGGRALKVMVTAVAEGGKANDAVLALIAREWRLAKRDLAIVAGATDRRKIIAIAGEPAQLLPALERRVVQIAG